MKVLFIGNSYTYYNDLPLLFEKLANENGHGVKAYSVTKGNRKLYENAVSGDEYAQKTDALIKENFFDYVFLQEYSTLPLTDRDVFENGVFLLCEKLKGSANNIVLYETWSRKEGCETLKKYGWTVRDMAVGLARAYTEVAEKYGASVSYVGLNFLEISDKTELYDEDKTHPSYKGSCLAALTHYYHVFKEYPHKTGSLSLDRTDEELFKKTVENTEKIKNIFD